MRRHLVRRTGIDPAELNITAFMNLMVILVPFLLITAVFSRIAILDLNLPTPSQAQQAKKQKQTLQLEVVIYPDRIDVADTNRGLIKRIRNISSGYDYKTLTNTLLAVKSRYPKVQSAMILAQSSTTYETLIEVMDKVRVAQQVQGASVVNAELFPDLSIGDAPSSGRSRRR